MADVRPRVTRVCPRVGAVNTPDARALDALGDSTRREILMALATDGPATASSLGANMPITRQAVAKHLGLLEDAGWLTRQRQGRETFFVFKPEGLEALDSWTRALTEQWTNRLGRLKKLAEDQP